ncbi:MAG TPA: STAS domain-containing protein [Thermodesulfobacteriota bacterium]|nr:STAS domain-containing protein [Thermodesulfobacteriota bacterium]
MEITKRQTDNFLELKIKGRLDGYWADHLTSELANVIREGTRQIRLNMAEVTYLSSAGIRVLLQTYKQLKGIQGYFTVSNPSEPVKTVLDLAGFGDLLISEPMTPDIESAKPSEVRQFEKEGIVYEILDFEPGASLNCQAIGNPELLIGCRFHEEDSYTMTFSDSAFALGVGALGSNFEDCRNRFGEFLSVAGAVAYLPTDGTNVPDYMLSTGGYIPEVNILYGAACEGKFTWVIHFEREKDSGAATLTKIVNACLEHSGSNIIGIAMIAESAGIVGAALRRSPTIQTSSTAPFSHPEIREWLSFTPERVYTQSLCLIVGIAARTEHPILAPMVRPLGKEPSPLGHFHATVFPYRPLKRNDIDLKTIVATLFETENVQDLLHLLSDDREIIGIGQSEFIRGTCWVGTISETSVKRNRLG